MSQLTLLDYASLDFECFAQYYNPRTGGIRQGECAYKSGLEPLNCEECPVFKYYYTEVKNERKKGASVMEAHFNVCDRLGIPVATI